MRRSDGALLRPGITLYGEIPFNVEEAAMWVNQADLIVIVGTSFVVYPFLVYYSTQSRVTGTGD